jgi:hypothetical protein
MPWSFSGRLKLPETGGAETYSSNSHQAAKTRRLKLPETGGAETAARPTASISDHSVCVCEQLPRFRGKTQSKERSLS